MVSADLPTPPPPTTTSRYFSCPGPSLQPAAMGEPGGAERGSAARSGASLPAAAFPPCRPPPARRRAAPSPAAHGARRRHSAGNGVPRSAAAPSRKEQHRAERRERHPPPQPGRRGYKWPPGGGAASSAMLMSVNIYMRGAWPRPPTGSSRSRRAAFPPRRVRAGGCAPRRSPLLGAACPGAALTSASPPQCHGSLRALGTAGQLRSPPSEIWFVWGLSVRS